MHRAVLGYDDRKGSLKLYRLLPGPCVVGTLLGVIGATDIHHVPLNRDGMGCRWQGFEFVKDSFCTGLAWGMMTVKEA